MSQAGMSGVRAIAVLSILPLATLFLAFSYQSAHGPHWFYLNSDPDYFYLCDSITVAQFKTPDCVLHPGTPVTVLGALVQRVVHLFSGQRPFVEDVLASPERYLYWMNVAILYPFVFLSFYVGWRVLRACGCFLPALIAQLAPLFSFTVMDALATVKPEPMQIWASMLLGMWMLEDACSIPDEKGEQAKFHWRAIGYGVVIGFGLAVKFTSIPYALLPLCLLPLTRKAWLQYGAASAASFLFFVLPALTRWKWFYKNMVLVSSHSGLYGAGKQGLDDMGRYVENFKELLWGERWFACVLGLSIVCALAGLIALKNRSTAKNRALRFLAALILVEIIHLVLTTKQPALRYLIPSYVMSGVNFALIYQLFKSETCGEGYAPFKVAYGCAITAFAAWAIHQNLALRDAMSAETSARLEFCRKMEPEIKAGHLIFGHVASSIENATHRGNFGYSRSRYSKEITNIHPNLIFFLVPRHVFIRGMEDLTPEKLAEICRAQPMKMLADPDWAKANCPPGFELKLIEKFMDEGYFEVLEKKP